MLLTGETVSAKDALNVGLVTRVVAQDQRMTYAMDMAQTIAFECTALSTTCQTDDAQDV